MAKKRKKKFIWASPEGVQSTITYRSISRGVVLGDRWGDCNGGYNLLIQVEL